MERVVTGINERLPNQQVRFVRLTDSWKPAYHPLLPKWLTGRARPLCRHGKYMFFRIHDEDDVLRTTVAHLGMSGTFRWEMDFKAHRADKHDHWALQFEFDDTAETMRWLVYNDPRRFGHLYALDGEPRILSGLRQPHEGMPSMGLGPDALWVAGLEATAGARLLMETARQNRPLKEALLSQSWLAGIGNIYASEALHYAKLHPETTGAQLQPKEWLALHYGIKRALEAGMRAGGTVIAGANAYKDVDGQLGGSDHLRVYGRGDRKCLTCSTEAIRKSSTKGRATYWCPRCQPRPNQA